MFIDTIEEEEALEDTEEEEQQQQEEAMMDVFKQDVPTMRGIQHYQYNKWQAWAGGKPRADWRSLDTSA